MEPPTDWAVPPLPRPSPPSPPLLLPAMSAPRVLVLAAGSAVLILAASSLFASVPVTDLNGVHSCPDQGTKRYDANTIVAQIGEDKRWGGVPTYLLSPILYAVGSGLLAAVLIHGGGRERKGIVAVSDSLLSSLDAPVLLGATCAILLMALLSADFDSSSTWITSCQTPTSLSGVKDLLSANPTLFAAAALSSLRDAFLVAALLGDGRESGGVVEVLVSLVPNLVLVSSLSVSLRQRGASTSDVVSYGSFLATLYLVFFAASHAVLRAAAGRARGGTAAASVAGRFFSALVPCALAWVLFCDLVPHCFIFTDPQGDQIPTDMRVGEGTPFSTEGGEVRTIRKGTASVFNNRALVVDAVLVATILLSVHLMNRGSAAQRRPR